MKLAFVFPGQGSQYVGMGKEMYDEFAQARLIFEEACDEVGFDIKKMCFEGSDAELKNTANTQPAILTVSVACLQVLKDWGIKPVAVAGHSLGEYSALVAAGSLTFANAVKIVHKRGKYMQECAPQNGGMAAILGLDSELVIKSCQQASNKGVVEVANFNCPGQTVIAGEADALASAMEIALSLGARMAVPLQVSGPFHSSLMKEAGEKLAAVLADSELNEPNCPVISNVTAGEVELAADIKDLLVRQVSSAVRWDESIKNLSDLGVEIFIEIGPGKVLTGFGKRIIKGAKLLNVENVASLEKSLANLKEV